MEGGGGRWIELETSFPPPWFSAFDWRGMSLTLVIPLRLDLRRGQEPACKAESSLSSIDLSDGIVDGFEIDLIHSMT